MTSKLGVYWSVAHRRPQDYQYFSRLQPSVMKVMDAGDNDIAWIKSNLPNSLDVARIHALSEQHSDMVRDPVGTGKRHAVEWDGHATRLGIDRAKNLILGINEPKIWEGGVPEALRLYTIAMCDEASHYDLRVGAMQLGVGWPNNTGPDTPPDWSSWHGVEDAIRRNNGVLVTHEYWADQGPSENWGWWAGRALKCPWQVPIVIGECGIDMYVKVPSVEHFGRGWNGRMPPEQYARELAEYVSRMSADSRFVGACVFASDYANREWASFDVEPAYQAILSTPIVVTPPVTPPTPSAPVAGSGYVQTHLNVRSGPGTTFPVVEVLPPNYAVRWTGKMGEWLLIGSDRWIHGGYVGWVPPAPPTPSPPVVTPPEPPPVAPATSGIIEPRVAQAILQVESGGRTHGDDGRIIVRFEAHIFKTYLRNDALWAKHFRTDPTQGWVDQGWRKFTEQAWQSIHTGKQDHEWEAFEFALSMDSFAAFMSISMGAPQIMGFNHARIGYPSAPVMFKAFQSALVQTIGFINFFLSDPALTDAMRRKNWREIALRYNGSGAVDTYAPLLERTYRELAND